MKPLLLILLILTNALKVQAKSLPPENLERSRAQAYIELQKLKSAPPEGAENGRFFFLPALVPATSAAFEFVTMAFATGFISFALREELIQRLEQLDQYDDYDQAVSEVSNVFRSTDQAIARTLSNVDKLRDQGYDDQDLEYLASSISEKDFLCRQKENNNSPDSFCPDYKKSFFREGYKIESRNGGFVVTKRGKVQCCLEWDSLHCGFEIFQKGVHKGEVGCLEDEFNPCQFNESRGSHAKPQPQNHKPRSSMCSK
ncbi:MAG: hypothetical protein KDD61_16450 [Bdellovibrionales bacterium]|nr:hypothetical protein [Bdellovibrionales bacterium]